VQYAFDLDGTLIDSREAVYRSYIDAGVTPPKDFFGKPFSEWFEGTADEANVVRAKKAAAYASRVDSITCLPLMSLFKILGRQLTDQVTLVTGASAESVRLLASRFAFPLNVAYVTGCTMGDKVDALLRTSEEGIMFEDDRAVAAYLRKHTRWTICCTC